MDNFILEVKSHTHLWDVNHMYFRDIPKKRDTWELVAEKCGIANGEEAKQLWSKIRSSHREAMRRRAEDKNLRPWKYEDIMEFLITRTVDNKNTDNSIINTTDNIIKEDADVESNAQLSPLNTESNKLDNNPMITVKLTSPVSLNVNKSVDTAINPIRKVNNKRHRLHNSYYEVDSNLNERWNKVEKKVIKQCPSTVKRDNDGMGELFKCLCEKTRNLPKYLQLRVQREIFESITKAEEEALSASSCPEVFKKRNKLKIRATKKFIESTSSDRSFDKFTDPLELTTHEHKDTTQQHTISSDHVDLIDDPIENIHIKTDPDEENV
ncbi:unnamed protein product [Diatraea saccharalis]|uniref:MADF domain-containing protein n=1 Tax=Diatraea saccharalis TaxID=40085 RepID=A0A9N9QL34_9NEOP|nr:unnamed protein product [Diatraea saccharalis]